VTITTRTHIYLGSLASVTLVGAALLALAGDWHGNPWVVVGLAGVALVAERARVHLSTSIEESISLLPTLFAAVLFGPLPAMVVAAASFLAELRPANGTAAPVLRWGIYTCTRAITAAVTGIAATAAASLLGNHLTAMLVATTVGVIVSEALDVAFAALTFVVRGGGSPVTVFKTLGPVTIAAVPLYAPVVAVLAYAYTEISPLTLVLFFVPALAAQRLYALYQDQRRLTTDLVSANEVLEAVNLSFATALVATLDARDRYTAGHSAAVAIYARDIAARLGLSPEEQQRAHLAGLVHDIGKIGLPAGLLEKPGALTLDERRQMEQHATIGEGILRNVETYGEIAAIVRHHHERVDGHGYPDRLAKAEIPLLARIIAVADAYNAMTSDRPYRDAMPSRVARLRLAQAVESQFDTSVVAAFEAILATESERYRLAQDPEFRFHLQRDTLRELTDDLLIPDHSRVLVAAHGS
jgi:putative nucleotidyltransferase with HDIG domain